MLVRIMVTSDNQKLSYAVKALDAGGLPREGLSGRRRAGRSGDDAQAKAGRSRARGAYYVISGFKESDPVAVMAPMERLDPTK